MKLQYIYSKLFNKGRVKDLGCNILFVITYLIIILILMQNGKFILGSTTDFAMQHYIIPDYFRSLFYDTFDLFPDFAFNLGAGGNIYYLSYYGLLNPIILFSYLFPKIKMLDYILISMSLVVIGSTSLLYFYFRKNNYSRIVSFLGAFMFLCSAPLIFHSHRHIMFIDYFPFLIMGFYGIDNFVIKKKSFLLIIATTLMIFTSYYYSVSGIVVLFILGIYKYIKINNDEFKKVLFFAFKLLWRFIVSILISAILVLPTFYTLVNGRDGSGEMIQLLDLFKPNIYTLYSSYSIGLTLISFISLFYMFWIGKKEKKLLALLLILVSVFPIFNYVLNGCLYINSKVLIPFVPIVLINVSDFLTILFNKFSKLIKNILIFYILGSSFVICLICNLSDKLILQTEVDKDFNINYDDYIKEIISCNDVYRINTSYVGKSYANKVGNLSEYKTTIYSSTFNKNYKKIYSDLFHNPLPYRNKFMLANGNNILFQMYMGERYLMTMDNYDNILNLVRNDGSVKVYENKYVFSLGYATDKVINEKEFDNLSYPVNVINMLGKVVVDKPTNVEFINLDRQDISYRLVSFENLDFKRIGNGYEVLAGDNATLRLQLDKISDDQLIFINFDILENVSCDNSDLSITINGIRNKLTCKDWKYANNNTNFNYSIINNKNNILEIVFDKGNYEIGNIKISSLDFNKIKNITKDVDPFIIDKNETGGDNIVGNINVISDSYFTLSVPYDKGFSIFIDGKKTDYFQINKGFIGFRILKGYHNVKIIYEAPYKKISFLVSFIGLVFLGLVILYENRLLKRS